MRQGWRCIGDMPRTYLVFGDIEGKLDVLHVECTNAGVGGVTAWPG
jgi:hypothetical protein